MPDPLDPIGMPRVAVLLTGIFLAGCEPAPSRELVRLQAYRCAQARQESCKELPRGDAIATDSLPPPDEGFQVWAWHPGKGKVVYRLFWQSPFFSDSGAPVASREAKSVLADAGDSSTLAYNFAPATKTRYVLRVELEAPDGRILDRDSLVWDFSRYAAGGTPSSHTHSQ